MAKSISDTQKKRGRPRTGTTPMHHIRFPSDLTDRIDAWLANRPEPRPSRSEAIRQLVEKGLAGERGIQSDASLDHQIAEQKAAIAAMPEHSKPSPEAAMAAMDKAMAKNDLVDMKNKRTRRKNATRK